MCRSFRTIHLPINLRLQIELKLNFFAGFYPAMAMQFDEALLKQTRLFRGLDGGGLCV
jgi:hypothetical protein